MGDVESLRSLLICSQQGLAPALALGLATKQSRCTRRHAVRRQGSEYHDWVSLLSREARCG